MAGVPVALVSQHPVLITGLLRTFASDERFQVIAQGRSTADVRHILRSHTPALIVLDLPSDDVCEALSIIKDQSTTIRAIVFTAASEVGHALQAFEAGAAAYVSASSTADELLTATRTVLGGEAFVSPNIATDMAIALQQLGSREAFAISQKLNAREEEIIGHLLSGKTNKAIALSLGLSETTVKHHMTVLMNKLQVKNRLELVMMIKAFGSQKRAPHP
jgi:DNA-binding NarL/FixJ family response regulator